VDEASKAVRDLNHELFANHQLDSDEDTDDDVPRYTGTDNKFSKIHAISHFPDLLRMYGFPTLWDTTTTEKAWITWGKDLYPKTQRRGATFTGQMMNKQQDRKLVRLLADYLNREDRMSISAPPMTEGGVIGHLGATAVGRPMIMYTRNCNSKFDLSDTVLERLYSKLLGAFMNNFPTDELEEGVKQLLRKQEIRVLSSAYIKAEVPCRVHSHPCYAGERWDQDKIWYNDNEEKKLGRVVLILEYNGRRSFFLEPCECLRAATAQMPIDVWRRVVDPTGYRLVNTVSVVEPQRTCRAYGDIKPPGSQRINKKTDFFIIDPEVFGCQRTSDAVDQKGDLRFV
jgi:hypothetical protein